MVDTHTCINNPKVPRKKRSAKRLWRVVLSKQSAMTASSTLLPLFEPVPKMRTFFEVLFIRDKG